MLDLLLKLLTAILKPFASKAIDEASRSTIAEDSVPVDRDLRSSLYDRVRESESRTGPPGGSD